MFVKKRSVINNIKHIVITLKLTNKSNKTTHLESDQLQRALGACSNQFSICHVHLVLEVHKELSYYFRKDRVKVAGFLIIIKKIQALITN